MKYMKKDQLLQKAYENFKLLWCMQHGHTLKDIFCSVCDWNTDNISDTDCSSVKTKEKWFNTWESESIANSEIYPCFDDFLENEFKDKSIRTLLLTPEELEMFSEDGYKVCGYDKDSDAYECFGCYDDMTEAMKKLIDLTVMHRKKELRRTVNNEPFDWFEIINIETDKTVALGIIESSYLEGTSQVIITKAHVKITIS